MIASLSVYTIVGTVWLTSIIELIYTLEKSPKQKTLRDYYPGITDAKIVNTSKWPKSSNNDGISPYWNN